MEHYKSLNGKTALVTGGGSGIGRASAVQLAKQGVHICIVDLKEDRAAETKEAILSEGGNAIIYKADASSPDETEKAFNYAGRTFGRLDIVFANAGINGVVSPIEELEPEEWDKTVDTNLKSTFLSVKYALPYMKKRGGSIIITSSVNGTRIFSSAGMSAYSSSKAAQVTFAKMAAVELANYRIRVNAICPGAFKTNIGENTHPKKEALEKIKQPVENANNRRPPVHKREEDPKQAAELVSFLASDASAHITGSEIYIDGASSLL